MLHKNLLEEFLNYILSPLILVFGLFGNLLGLTLLIERKKLATLGTRRMYIYLFIMDTIYLFNILINFLQHGFNYQVTSYTHITCKLNIYFAYSLANISPMILVYISIERLIEIRYPVKRFVLQKSRNQLIYLFCIISFNVIYYTPFAFEITRKKPIDDPNASETCMFNNISYDSWLSYMDMVNRVLIPFILMTISSILLVYSIFRSRSRVFKNYTTMENRVFKKDLKLAMTSLLLNFFYIVLSLPVSIIELLDYSHIAHELGMSLFYATYSVNFYVVLVSNILFREEFLLFMNIKTKYHSPSSFIIRYTSTIKTKETVEIVSIIES